MVEVSSLLARLVREGSLPAANAAALSARFVVHTDSEYLLLPLDPRTLTQARTLVGKYPLRTLDAIQLASAQTAGSILAEPITFVSSDQDLLAAAVAEGFPTDDPLKHP
jgi:predicted nucleic acid-binding protein